MQLGVKDFETRLLQFAKSSGYQVLLGEKWIGGSLGSCWDSQRRAAYHRFQEARTDRAWGLCDFQEKVIWLDPRMNQQHRVSVLVHELGHALLHEHERSFNHKQWEAEAEEVRRIVGEAVGINLPPNDHDWEGLSERRKRKAFRRGCQASGKILRVVEG